MIIYTLLLLVGGVMGYVKGGSVASLIVGLASSILLTLFTFLTLKGSKMGGLCLLAVIFILDAFFSWRFINTLSVFPSGLFALLSTIMLIIMALRIQKQKLPTR